MRRFGGWVVCRVDARADADAPWLVGAEQTAWILRFAQDDGLYGWGDRCAGAGARVDAVARGIGGDWGSRGLRGCGVWAADWGGGDCAGLPEQDELIQAAEDAGEDGRDQGVHCVRQPGAGFPRRNCGLEVGDLGAEGGWLD